MKQKILPSGAILWGWAVVSSAVTLGTSSSHQDPLRPVQESATRRVSWDPPRHLPDCLIIQEVEQRATAPEHLESLVILQKQTRHR